MRRRIIKVGLALVLAAMATVGLARLVIIRSADGSIKRSVAATPHAPVAIVLGAGVKTNNKPSLALTQRVEAAASLYRAGKVRHLLLSGDNSTKGYDEPTAMRRVALSAGVPAADITMDFAGFDTWDTCVRAHKVFRINRAIVVTHSFHADRAVALCDAADIRSTAFAVADFGGRTGRNVRIREWLASPKAAYEMLVAPDPRFLGKPEGLTGSVKPTNGE